MNDFVDGNKLGTHENDTNESAEQNIDKNSFDEYEDKSLKLDFDCMSDAQELGSSAHLEQAFWKSMFPTSSPLSFEKSISQLDQSSICSNASNTEICTKEVSISEKTPNVPSQAALLEIETKFRQAFDQKMFELRQELMSKLEAKMSNGMNDVRAVSGSTYWSAGGDESSSKTDIGSYIEESEVEQLAVCRNIIENTPILKGYLAGITKRALYENKAQDLSDDVAGLTDHCNDFAKTRDKLEAGNESSKKTAQDLDLTLKKQETEKQSDAHQIESLQNEISAQNHSIDQLNEEKVHPGSAEKKNRSLVEEMHVEKDKINHLNTANDELKPAFDKRNKMALFALAALLLLAFFALAWFGVGLELKLTQETSNGMDHYKVSTQREIENLRNSLDAEIKHRRKTESELKSAQGSLDELRRVKAEAEKALTRPGQASWLSTTFIVLILLYLTLVVVGSFCSNGINALNCLFLLSLSFVVGAWLAVPWYYVTLVVMCWVTFIKIFADNSSKS